MPIKQHCIAEATPKNKTILMRPKCAENEPQCTVRSIREVKQTSERENKDGIIGFGQDACPMSIFLDKIIRLCEKMAVAGSLYI